jgi:hypothetical protein
MTRWERLKYTFVEPDTDGGREAPVDERSADELQEALRRADDRERAVGLIAAPVAAVISFGIITALVDRDHTPGAKVVASVSTLHELLLVLLGLSVLMLVTALWRKRLFLGIVLAIYGVSLFQLGWLGFAVPFVLAGAWYIVRQFRMQSALRRATEADAGPSSRRTAAKPANGARPRPSKRYTPPT